MRRMIWLSSVSHSAWRSGYGSGVKSMRRSDKSSKKKNQLKLKKVKIVQRGFQIAICALHLSKNIEIGMTVSPTKFSSPPEVNIPDMVLTGCSSYTLPFLGDKPSYSKKRESHSNYWYQSVESGSNKFIFNAPDSKCVHQTYWLISNDKNLVAANTNDKSWSIFQREWASILLYNSTPMLWCNKAAYTCAQVFCREFWSID